MASVQPEVAFQVDTSAKTGVFEWCSVTGEGTVEAVTDPAEIARIPPFSGASRTSPPGWPKNTGAATAPASCAGSASAPPASPAALREGFDPLRPIISRR
jgi:hypothetical protein